MQFSTPPPTNRTLLPSAKRRVVFALVGLAAVFLRFITSPVRAVLARSCRDRPVFLYEPYGMGDVLALQPLVLAHLAAGRRVVLAARAPWKDLIPPHPSFTFVPVSPAYASTDATKKYRGFVRSVLSLARLLYPYAAGADGLDVRGDVRSLVILYLAGCGSVYTLPRYYTANDCLVMPFAARRVEMPRNVSRRLLNGVFAPAGVVLTRSRVNHLLPSPPPVVDDHRIGIIALTPWIGKCWFPELWRETIDRLRADSLCPILLCGPDEKADALAAIGCSVSAIECHEADDVRSWVAELAECGAIITVNTGPMHLADALDKPLVVLEGSSRLPLWAPEGNRAFVVHHQDVAACAPCHQVGDTITCGRRCMRLILPDEVIAALATVRGKRPS